MNNPVNTRNVTATAPLLRVNDLCVAFTTDEGTTTALNGISFDLFAGEILGIAGESGSGKSVTALAILNLLPRPAAHIVRGQILFDERDIFQLNAEEKQHIRGKRIAMIFQEPVSALNPVQTIGQQLAEVYRTHFSTMSALEITTACIEMLTQVGIAEPARRLQDYPHQLSGGQCQRVMIAMALACKPDILIADEPTTALDVTTQQQILQLLRELQPVFGMSVIFITHDLSVIAHLCDRVIIMEHGVIRETDTVQRIFTQAQNAYTQQLLGAMLTMDSARQPSSLHTTPETLLEIRSVSKSFPLTGGIFGRTRGHFQALHDISFSINRGETLGLVGESGCGKSTLGRAILQLDRPSTGEILFNGTRLNALNQHDMHLMRRRMQVIFQNANDSLNPRHTVGTILEEPFIIHRIGTPTERARWCLELLDKVELDSASIHRYPHQLSGGQRQRIGIARALALKPEFIVCDEPVSALDVTTQHHILELLLRLKQEFNLTLLFISHDLAVVKHIADRVAVMYQGGIVEIADTATLFDNPQHPYTSSLLAAIPRILIKASQKGPTLH